MDENDQHFWKFFSVVVHSPNVFGGLFSGRMCEINLLGTSSYGSSSAAGLHSQTISSSQEARKDPTMPAQIWGNSGMHFLRVARAEPSSCQELPGKQHMGTKGCRSSDLSPQTSHQTRFPPPLPPTTSMKRKHMMPDMCSNTHTH